MGKIVAANLPPRVIVRLYGFFERRDYYWARLFSFLLFPLSLKGNDRKREKEYPETEVFETILEAN